MIYTVFNNNMLSAISRIEPPPKKKHQKAAPKKRTHRAAPPNGQISRCGFSRASKLTSRKGGGKH